MRIDIKFSGYAVDLGPDELRGATDAEVTAAVRTALGDRAERHVRQAAQLVRSMIDERDKVTLAQQLARGQR